MAHAGRVVTQDDALRARLGTPFRYRHERGRGLHAAAAAQDRRRPCAQVAPDSARHGLLAARSGMRPNTLRGRIALWSAARGNRCAHSFRRSRRLGIFAASWWKISIRRFKDEAADFAAEMDEQQVQSSQGEKTMAFSSDDLPRFPYVEVHGTGQRLLYRAPALGKAEVIPVSHPTRPYELKVNGQPMRFALFHRGGITYAVGKDLGQRGGSARGASPFLPHHASARRPRDRRWRMVDRRSGGRADQNHRRACRAKFLPRI